MATSTMRLSFLVLALIAVIGFGTTTATAQCSSCGTYAVGYQPATYTTYYSGWYPGYWLDRMRASWWGTGYYTTSYRARYTAAYPGYYTSYYAPSCSTCSPCSSCSSCGSCGSCGCTTYQPVLLESASPCCSSPCSSGCCGGSCGVTSASYESYESPGCSTCGVSTASAQTTILQSSQPPQGQLGQPMEPTPAEPPPALRQGENPPLQRDALKLPSEMDLDEGSSVLEAGEDDSAGYFEPPQLFRAPDRTTQNDVKVPVWTAVYHHPADQGVTRARTTQRTASDRVELNSAGWTSISD